MIQTIKVVTAKEMSRIEGLAYAAGCQDVVFMEQAGASVASLIDKFVLKHGFVRVITLLVGKGNNGGDAYVAGRKLLEMGYRVEACHIYSLDQCGPLCRHQCELFIKSGGKVHFIQQLEEIRFQKEGVLLDGLVGTGFTGKAEGVLADAIEAANKSSLPIIAIDIPSGLCGNTGSVDSVAIEAIATIYLELPKIGFFLQKGANYTGELVQAHFGLPKEYAEMAKAEAFWVDPASVKELLPEIRRVRHKYDAGYVLAIAGSPSMSGAAILSCYSALRSGAGIVRWFYPEGMETSFAPYEIIKEAWDGKDFSRFKEESKRANAYLLGPGLGRDKKMQKMVKKILIQSSLPVVIDADALFFLAKKPSWKLPPSALLTPHMGEMNQILSSFGSKQGCFLERCKQYAIVKQVSVLVKGAPNFLFTPHDIPWILSVGNPGMATAGSGDVLTGIISALLAQGLCPKSAAILGCCLHGKAGDIAAQEMTPYSLVASDIMAKIPQAISFLLA